MHWIEYAYEAGLLGAFMISACLSTAVVVHPASPVAASVRSPLARRTIIGICMGLTAVVLITSPWGQRSGAHMNPATTLTFLLLGKVAVIDAAMYVAAQAVGGAAGVWCAHRVLRGAAAHPSVNFVQTLPGRPGRRGVRHAWAAEFVISCLLMSTVLTMSNHADLAAYTPLAAGLLVAMFITVEAPISGMSMNPARSLASAVHARSFRALPIYFTAPPAGMLVAAALHVSLGGVTHCAKIDHRGGDGHACIFRNCTIDELRTSPDANAGLIDHGSSGLDHASRGLTAE